MIKYPNGKEYKVTSKRNIHKNKIEISISSSNRGMEFENEINLSNAFYKEKNICLITKRPTPINVVKVDYSRGAKIVDAYFEKQSTTDYNGVYKGRYIDFEAKSTKNKTSFPLNNISSHQIEHLKNVIFNDGIAFFIFNFELLKEVYILKAEQVIEFILKEDRKSIPYSYFKECGYIVEIGFNPIIKYIDVIDKIYFE